MSENVRVSVEAIGNFSNLMGEVNKFKAQLQKLKLPKDIGDKLEKSLDEVEKKALNFQSILNKGVKTKGDFSKLLSSAKETDRAIEELKKDMASVSNTDFKIAVANSSEIKKAEQALEKVLKLGKQFSSYGTSKAKGPISEAEVARIDKLIGKSATLRTKFEAVGNAFKTGNVEYMSSAINKLIEHVGRYQKQMNQSTKTPGKGNQLMEWAQELNQLLNKTTAEADRMRSSLDKLRADKVAQVKKEFSGVNTEINKNTTSISQYIREQTQAAAKTAELNNQVGMLKTQANYFFGLQNIGRLISRGIRQAAESVKELDKAMTETAVVTDFSVGDMWNMLPEYTALANKLGATTQGAYETMTLYFQQGLDKQATFEIGEETMKMARIAGLDYADTTNMMTAALRGFNMELNQTSAQRVNDVYSKLAAITASDTRELGLAMERTASIAHSANMDFGNVSAFLAQMIETTREAPENLGTAMKTIIARFQELKENPYSISEVEGEEVDFNRVDKALKSIGVQLMDSKDKFRDLDDVFLDISARWDGLSQTQQRYVATIAAGARQQSRFLAMVQNYDRLKQLSEAAANSEGASEVQFAKTLESLESKTNKLKNAWQAFTMSLANSGAIKGVVDVLKDIVSFGNKIIETFGKVGKLFGGNFGKGLMEMIAAFGLGAVGFKGLKFGANMGLGLLAKRTGAASGGMFTTEGGQGADSGMASKISNPIVSAINRVIAVIQKRPVNNDANFQGARGNLATLNERRSLLNKMLTDTTSHKELTGKSGKTKTVTEGIRFSGAEAAKIFSGLGQEEAKMLYNQNPVLSKALQRGYAKAYEGLRLDKVGQKQLTQHFQDINNKMKNGTISVQDGLKHLYDPTSVLNALGKTEEAKQVEDAIRKQMKSWTSETDKAISKEIAKEANKKGLKGKARGDFYLQEKRRVAAGQLGFDVAGEATGKVGKAERAMTKFSNATNNAGQAVMGLGMALMSAGFTGAGSLMMTIGNGIMGIGMAAQGASTAIAAIGTKLKALKATNPELLALSAIVAAAVATIGVVVAAQKKAVKETRKAGKEVTKTYKDTVDNVEKELGKIIDYRENWGKWSQGIDENGYNINLGTSEYEDYQKAVKELTQSHPELIKGFNAVGNAIVDNNSVLDEATKLAKKEEQQAKKTYLSLSEGDKIANELRTYKRFEATQDPKGRNKTRQMSLTGSHSDLEIQASEAITAIRELDGGKEILKDYKIAFDEFGNLTEASIERLRTNGGNLNNALNELYAKADEKEEEKIKDASKKIGKFGKTIEGLETVTKDYYDWGWEYASSKGFDKIDSNLLVPFQTGIQRLAEKGLSAGDFADQIDKLGASFKELGGHASDYKKIENEIAKAQEDFSSNLNSKEYQKKVNDILDNSKIDEWIEELTGKTDIADRALGEFFNTQKERFLNLEESFPTFEEAVNTLSGDIESANAAYDNWTKEIESGDYYTAREGFKKMYDEVNDGVDDLGKKSQSWWKAARAMMGDDYVLTRPADEVASHMKQIGKYFQDGQKGVDNFVSDVRKKLDTKLPGGETLEDYFVPLENGGLKFDFENVDDEKFQQIATALGLSKDALVAMINAARQFSDIDFSNASELKQALAVEGNPVGTDGKVFASEKDIKTRLIGEGLTPEKADKKIEEMIETGAVNLFRMKGDGSTALKTVNDKTMSDYVAQWGIAGKGKTEEGLNTTTALDLVTKLRESGLDETDAKAQFKASQGLISDNQSFEDAWQQSVEYDDPLYSPVTNIESAVFSILNAIQTNQVRDGVLTNETKNRIDSATKEGVNFGQQTEHYDNYEDYSARRKELREEIETTKASLEEGIKTLDPKSAVYSEFETRIDECSDALEALKTNTPNSKEDFEKLQQVEGYADKIDSTRGENGKIDIQSLLDLDPSKLDGIAATMQEKLQGAFKPVEGQDLFGSAEQLATITAGLEQTGEAGKKSADEIKQAFIEAQSDGIAKLDGSKLQKLGEQLGLTENQIKDIAKEYNIDFKTNSEETQKDIKDTGKQADDEAGKERKLSFTTKAIEGLKTWWDAQKWEIDATASIVGWNAMPSRATGQNNPNSAFHRTGTMARGSRSGYTIPGRPTLTGEEGEELVWEPKRNEAYMVGSNGPQFANITRDAVVWNADQTRRIKKNSGSVGSFGLGARGIKNFGTMDGGNTKSGRTKGGVGGSLGKIPGFVNVDAKVDAVAEPDIQPEIPVTAKLEVNSGGKGKGNLFQQLLKKLGVGGKEGTYSINVTGSVKNIVDNTGGQKTINVVGKVTNVIKGNALSVSGVKATATVTSVKKGSKVKGEPVKVSAKATIGAKADTSGASKKIEAAAKAAGSTQTMKIKADTSSAQSKINSLISKFNKTYKLKYKASGPDRVDVPIYANFKGKWEHEVKITKSNGGKSEGGKGKHLGQNYKKYNSYAKGTGPSGIRGNGKLTLTGEEGYEVVWLPNQGKSMIVGIDGPQMLKLPSSAVVWPHDQSKKILNQDLFTTNSFASGKNISGSYYPASSGTTGSSKKKGRGSRNKNKGGSSNKNQEKATNLALKNGHKFAHVVAVAGKAVNYWWENMTRKVDKTQRKIDRIADKIDKTFAKFGITLASSQKMIAEYRKELNKQINLNTTMRNQAAKNLRVGSGERMTAAEKASVKRVNENVKKAQPAVDKAQAAYFKARNKAEDLDFTYYSLDDKGKKSKKGKTLEKQLKAARKEETKAKKAYDKAVSNQNKRKTGSNWQTISYEQTEWKRENGKKTSSKVTKNERINIAPYISYDPKTGAYMVDYKKINNLFKNNRAKGEAIGKAANEFIDKEQDRYNKAEDVITKAREELENLANDIYKTFYSWEKSITKIYFLSQKLEEISKRIEIAGSRSELQIAKFEAGIGDGLERLTDALDKERTAMSAQVTGNKLNLEAAQTEFRNSLNFSTYAKKYLANKDSTDAKADYQAASKAFEMLEKAGLSGDNFSYQKALDVLKGQRYNEETYNKIKEVLDNINEKQSNYLDAINDTYGTITEIYSKMEEYQSFIADFEEGLLEGIEEQAENELNKLEKLNSSLTKALSDLITEVKNKLDERRKKEDNAKTESDIAKKQQRLAALRADTSGGKQTEIAQLQKEIADAQQSYQRTLEDQLLDRLQKQGDKAEKQREHQINLLEAQNKLAKETGGNLKEVKLWLSNPTKYKAQIKEAYLANNDYENMPPGKRSQLEQQFESDFAQYQAYSAQLPEYQKIANSKLASIETSVDKIANNMVKLTGDRSAKTMRANKVTAKQLRTLGYKASSLVKGGYATGSIVKAGYSAKDLKAAGITASAIKKYNKGTKKNKVTAKDMKKAGYSVKEARTAGFTNKQIRAAGYTATQFKNSGQSATAAKKTGYSNKSIAKAYGATAAMTTLNMSGKSTQAITGASLKTLQKVVNKSSKDKAVQTDLAGVKASIDINGSKTGGRISGSVNASGKTITANKGSTLYMQSINTKTGEPTGKISKVTIDKLKPEYFKYNKKEATDALVYAITHQAWGSKINKNFKALAKAAGINGNQYTLVGKNHNWKASIGTNGLIYQNAAKHTGVARWNPATGKTDLIKYDKKKFLNYAKLNNTVSREFAQVLINRKAYTKKQLQGQGVKKFASGGLATQTGPAWLDGTPSKPELVLNAQDTKNFMALKDVLDHAVHSTNATNNSYGDTNFEININVDHINNDYDVDKIADRIKKDITKNAGYRNVTQVRNFR